ncbi:MAG TPA: ABC transporter permease subunit [Woeseiaceae bacterium]|nr:ABC transporter permease subunit [Woeseiaceae bacterium]
MSLRAALSPLAGRTRGVRLGAWLLLGVVALAVLGPELSPHDYRDTNFDARLLPPGLAGGHLFGTDELGRDLFVRTLTGTRVTLLVALVASLVSLVIGVAWGSIAGYAGGRIDAFMMRAVDALYALPFIFLVILLMVAFERNFFLIFVAIGAINWLDMARIVRGQTLSLKQREFVLAAELLGVRPAAVLWRHVMPNLLGVVVVYLTLTIPQAILVESFLSFLGLGVQEPGTSLGALVNSGVAHMERAPWLLLVPSTLLALVLFCCHFLGDDLRDRLDPRRSGS